MFSYAICNYNGIERKVEKNSTMSPIAVWPGQATLSFLVCKIGLLIIPI